VRGAAVHGIVQLRPLMTGAWPVLYMASSISQQ
jgi:hypothetical protein